MPVGSTPTPDSGIRPLHTPYTSLAGSQRKLSDRTNPRILRSWGLLRLPDSVRVQNRVIASAKGMEEICTRTNSGSIDVLPPSDRVHGFAGFVLAHPFSVIQARDTVSDNLTNGALRLAQVEFLGVEGMACMD